MSFSQRDGRWAGQRLGTVNDWTLGKYGCYVTAQAESAAHFGKNTNPSDLDNVFTERGLYIDGGLCYDGMLSAVYPDIRYAGTYHCEDIECDLSVLNAFNAYDHEAILEIDFDHNPGNGLQTHFVRMSSYDPTTGRIMIDDPWHGDTVDFATRYGDPRRNIYKVVQYIGPDGVTLSPVPTPPAPEVVDVGQSNPEAAPSAPQPAEPSQPPAGNPATDAVPTGSASALPDPVTVQIPNIDNPTNGSHNSSTPPVDQSGQVIDPIVPRRKENDMVEKLKSRKLWVVVASFVLFALNGEWNQAMVVALGYLGIQGVVDAKAGK